MSNSALKEYFTTSVEPRRATLLVQGGHRSGKTTLLNALLGYHAFPYFAGDDDDIVHGKPTTHYAAGLASTVVCAINVAEITARAQPLQVVRPHSGTIEQLKLKCSSTSTADVRFELLDAQQREADELKMKSNKGQPLHIVARQASSDASNSAEKKQGAMMSRQDSSSIGAPAPSAVFNRQLEAQDGESEFCLVDNVYSTTGEGADATAVGAGIAEPDPWLSRPTSAFYYESVDSMEAAWREWAAAVLNKHGDGQISPRDIDRLLFILRIKPEAGFATNHVDLPYMNVIEGTDLSDRPPMAFIHSNVVVVSDVEAARPDREGVQRLYTHTALITNNNTEPLLVYNLIEGSLSKMSPDQVGDLRSALAKKWNLNTSSIFIFSARKALADAMLHQEGVNPLNRFDSAELRRLKDTIASNHVKAHSRFVSRFEAAEEEKRRREEAQKESVQVAKKVEAALKYQPRSLTTDYQREDSHLASQAASAAYPTTSYSKASAAPAATSSYVPKCLANSAVTSSAQAAYVPRCLTKSPPVEEKKYVPKVLSESTSPVTPPAYVPRCMTSTYTVKQDAYVPKCLQQTTISQTNDYVPKCMAKQQSNGATTQQETPRHRIVTESNVASAPTSVHVRLTTSSQEQPAPDAEPTLSRSSELDGHATEDLKAASVSNHSAVAHTGEAIEQNMADEAQNSSESDGFELVDVVDNCDPVNA